MKRVVMIITIVFFCWVALIEGMVIGVRGKWLNDKEHLKLIKGLLKTGEPAGRIIYNNGLPFISLRSGSIFTEYAVDGFGTIPRWTEMHKAIQYWSDSVNHISEIDKEAILNKFK